MTSFKLEVNVAANHVFFSWVFGFSGKVKIKAPENVKAQYKRMIEQAALYVWLGFGSIKTEIGMKPHKLLHLLECVIRCTTDGQLFEREKIRLVEYFLRLRIDKQQKERYNNAVINNTVIAEREVKTWQIEITPWMMGSFRLPIRNF